MNINRTQNGDKIILALSGRLDTTTAQKLDETLIPEFKNTKNVELNFSELAYISSAGLRVLLFGAKAAKANNSNFTIVNVSQEIMETFQMTGFLDILNIK